MAVLTRWLGTQPFLGSLLPDMVQIIRYNDWAHLHSFSLLSEWTYKTQCDPALAPHAPPATASQRSQVVSSSKPFFLLRSHM